MLRATVVREGFVEEVALGLGLARYTCCLLAELGGFYFIFPVGGDCVVTSTVPGECVREVVGDRRWKGK